MAPPAEPPRIPKSEYEERRARAAVAAQASGLDGLLVWGRGGTLDSFSDVHYLAGYFSPFPWTPPMPPSWQGIAHAGVIITASGESSLLTTGEWSSDEVSIEDIRENANIVDGLVEAINGYGLSSGRLGLVGAEVLPYSFADALNRHFPSLTLEPADDLSSGLRLRLSDAEITLLRQAGGVGVAVLTTALDRATPGATEGELIGAALAKAAQVPGCTPWTFLTSSGPDAARFVSGSLPAWNPTYVYRAGDVLHIDAYGFVYGYGYDLGRTISIGTSSSSEQERVNQCVRDTVWTIAEGLKPGVTWSDLYERGAKFLAANGLQSKLGGLGHGLGAGFFRPYINPNDPRKHEILEPPLGLAIEVFAADEDGRSAFYEDNYLLLHDGVENLTSSA